MILVKSPLRLSFFGGGSDIESFYSEHGGACLSTTIDKYIYIAANRPRPLHDVLKIVYSVIEQVENVNEIKHDIVRETLKYFNINNRFELSTFADIPVKGTGLGSSSTFAVGLINACCALTKIPFTQYQIAEIACKVEIELCKQPIGKQDQYAAAFGGLREYRFEKNGSVYVTNMEHAIAPNTVRNLENNLMLFYTGVSRSASDILKNQFTSKESKTHTSQLVALVKDAQFELINNRVDNFGKLLDIGWMLKKQTNPQTTNQQIDRAYDIAKHCGALGGKIAGAGGGGYLLLYCQPQYRADVATALTEYGYKQFDFKFETGGCQVVYNDTE